MPKGTKASHQSRQGQRHAHATRPVPHCIGSKLSTGSGHYHKPLRNLKRPIQLRKSAKNLAWAGMFKRKGSGNQQPSDSYGAVTPGLCSHPRCPDPGQALEPGDPAQFLRPGALDEDAGLTGAAGCPRQAPCCTWHWGMCFGSPGRLGSTGDRNTGFIFFFAWSFIILTQVTLIERENKVRCLSDMFPGLQKEQRKQSKLVLWLVTP